MDLIRRFWEEEDGMGVVEIVMIIAALMCLALLFKKEIMQFAQRLMGQIFDETKVPPISDEVPK